MDLKRLEYLESIYRLRSFTKAAEEQFVSQPSISGAIQSLETELNVTLINRNTRPLSFTKAGEEFMTYVKHILADIKNAESAMKKYNGESKEHLIVAFASTAGNWLLPQTYKEFAQLYPQYRLTIIEDMLDVVMTKVRNEQLNMAYTLIPETLNTEQFDSIPVQNCELKLLMHKSHPLTVFDKISLQQLKDERLLTFPETSMLFQTLDSTFKKLNIQPDFLPVMQAPVMQELVEEQFGIAFIVQDDYDSFADHNTLTVRPLRNPIYFTRGFILKKNTQRTGAMNALISYIQKTASGKSR